MDSNLDSPCPSFEKSSSTLPTPWPSLYITYHLPLKNDEQVSTPAGLRHLSNSHSTFSLPLPSSFSSEWKEFFEQLWKVSPAPLQCFPSGFSMYKPLSLSEKITKLFDCNSNSISFYQESLLRFFCNGSIFYYFLSSTFPAPFNIPSALWKRFHSLIKLKISSQFIKNVKASLFQSKTSESSQPHSNTTQTYEVNSEPLQKKQKIEKESKNIVKKDLPKYSHELEACPSTSSSPTTQADNRSSNIHQPPLPMISYFTPYLMTYMDILYPMQSPKDTQILYAIALHFLNHLHQANQLQSDALMENFSLSGFKRPTLLFIVPVQAYAQAFIDIFLELAKATHTQIKNEHTYQNTFAETKEQIEAHAQELKTFGKSDDYIELFKGNQNDIFHMGIQINKKSIKLCSSVYKSDLILASPVGLQTLLGGSKEQNAIGSDFLSSIEIAVVANADIILQQNWEFLTEIIPKINQFPKKLQDANIFKIRPSSRDGYDHLFRQTILLSTGMDALFRSFFHNCANIRGHAILWNPTVTPSISKIRNLSIKQLFYKVSCSSFRDASKQILNEFLRSISGSNLYKGSGIVVLLPSYLDYIRIWKDLKSTCIVYKVVHEYSSQSMLTRAFHQFRSGSCKVLIVTARFQFFRQYNIQGISNLIFVGPPFYPSLYESLIKNVDKQALSFSMCYFTKFHANALERIVGIKSLPALLDAPDGKTVSL